jgi:glutamyl-tRNA synthetase
MNKKTNIISRYAPSPTGVQHLGNLRTALLAWLYARLQGGTFIVRMEDLDVPRVVAGSADQILRDLEWLGLDWDGEVMYQSTRTDAYAQAMSVIKSKGLVYPCFCSRKDIRMVASELQQQLGIYPGTCAGLSVDEVNEKSAVKQTTFRIRVKNNSIEFIDRCCGRQVELLSQTCGDYLIKRADGLFTYQLAVMVDDLDQGVSLYQSIFMWRSC